MPSEELKKGIPKAVVIGHTEYMEEEKEKHDRYFEKILKQQGVLKENQSIKDLKHPE